MTALRNNSIPDNKSVANMPTRQQLAFANWTKDILIYIIVLNLFVEHNAKITIDSFTISIFTAILLKILLEVILRFEHRLSDALKSYKVIRVILIWMILFGSKFLILEAVNLVFGDHVILGSLLDVVFLIIVLLASREIIKRIYVSLGRKEQGMEVADALPR